MGIHRMCEPDTLGFRELVRIEFVRARLFHDAANFQNQFGSIQREVSNRLILFPIPPSQPMCGQSRLFELSRPFLLGYF